MKEITCDLTRHDRPLPHTGWAGPGCGFAGNLMPQTSAASCTIWQPKSSAPHHTRDLPGTCTSHCTHLSGDSFPEGGGSFFPMPQVNNCVESGGGGCSVHRGRDRHAFTPSRLPPHRLRRCGSAAPHGWARARRRPLWRRWLWLPCCSSSSPSAPAPAPVRRSSPPAASPRRPPAPRAARPLHAPDGWCCCGWLAIALTDHALQWSIVHGGQGRTQPRMIPHSLF